MPEQIQSFKSSLRLIDATMLVAGSMIGSGIFIVSSDIARNVGSSGWLILVWLITGFMTLAVALSYGELSAMFPRAGGQYIYLKEAYNPQMGFVFGWTFFTVIQTATIAAVGVAFAKFTAYLIPSVDEDVFVMTLGNFKLSAAQLVSIAVIFILTLINTRGVSSGKAVQTSITLIKILSLILLMVFGFFAFDHKIWQANWGGENAWSLFRLNTDGSTENYLIFGGLAAIAAGMVGAIFSSDSWHSSTSVADEIKNPKRNVGLSLALGTIIVTVLYILTNLMYTSVMTMEQMTSAPKDRIAMVAAQQIFGPIGIFVIAIMIMISTFGCNNGLILAGARVYYSMAKDGLFFKRVGTLNRKQVPGFALWVQCIFASVWSLSGKYGDLLDMISIVVVIFYVLGIIGIFRLRRTRPDIERPYKAFGYPVIPAIYIIMGTAFCILMVIYKPTYTVTGIVIAALGLPVYYIVRKRNKQSLEA